MTQVRRAAAVLALAPPATAPAVVEKDGLPVGLKLVIPAWDSALAGQKEGARVMIVAPPDAAYGAAAQPGIPANSTLVFIVDVLGVG